MGGGEKTPDPGAAIGQQAQLAATNQITPWGNLTFSGSKRIRIPGKPDQFVPDTQTITLTPAQQALFDQQQATQLRMGQMGNQLAGQFPSGPQGAFSPTFAGPQAAFAPGDFEQSRKRVEDAQFQRAMSLFRPEMARQESAMQQRLANQGLPQASRAYTAETGQFADTQNRAIQDMALASVLAGGQEQSRLFGQDLATYETEAARRQQTFGQDLASYQAQQAQRNMQLNEILAMLGLVQVQAPQFQASPFANVGVPVSGGGGGGISPAAGIGTGALSGAASGAMLGSVVPGIGTGIGAAGGALAGGLMGYLGTRR